MSINDIVALYALANLQFPSWFLFSQGADKYWNQVDVEE